MTCHAVLVEVKLSKGITDNVSFMFKNGNNTSDDLM